jgi:hypothetical protein
VKTGGGVLRGSAERGQRATLAKDSSMSRFVLFSSINVAFLLCSCSPSDRGKGSVTPSAPKHELIGIWEHAAAMNGDHPLEGAVIEIEKVEEDAGFLTIAYKDFPSGIRQHHKFKFSEGGHIEVSPGFRNSLKERQTLTLTGEGIEFRDETGATHKFKRKQ